MPLLKLWAALFAVGALARLRRGERGFESSIARALNVAVSSLFERPQTRAKPKLADAAYMAAYNIEAVERAEELMIGVQSPERHILAWLSESASARENLKIDGGTP